MPTTQLQPMEFGEIYGTTFSLLKRTAGIALLSILLIAGVWVLYTNTAVTMMGTMAEAAQSGALDPGADPEAQQQAGMQMVGAMVPWLAVLVLMMIVFVYAQTMVTLAGWGALTDEPLSMGDAVSRSFGRPFWIALLQSIIVVVILGLLLFIISAVTTVATGGKAGLIQTLILLLAFAYPSIIISMRIHKIAIEGRGPWKGLIASIALVHPSFMRVFGILAVAAIGWGAIIYIQSIVMGTDGMGFNMGGNSDPEQMIKLYNTMKENLTPAAVLVGGLMTALAATFFFYLLTPVYADLRARRGEFLPVEDDDYVPQS